MKRKQTALTHEDMIIFSRQLALVIESEISLVEGLVLIQSKTQKNTLKLMLEDMIEAIKAGQSMAEAFDSHEALLTPYFTHMIHIGEASGDLALILNQIGDTYEKELETVNKVRSAVMYPLMLTVLMLGVIVLLIVEILPMFNTILGSLGGTMPAFTAGMMALGQFIGRYIWGFLLLIVLLAMLPVVLKSSEKGRYYLDYLAFKMPIQKGILSRLSAVRFARNLGLLIKSGMSFPVALKLIKPIMNNRYLENRMDAGITNLNDGAFVSDIIEDLDLFPWVLNQMFAVAQDTGHMDQVLFKAADVMEKDLDNQLTRLTTVIEPALILILSILIGIILISVILPIVDIMNAIG